jgi:hypothetical protein
MGRPKKKSATKVPAEWKNTQGQVVPMNAPTGGGGPGRFRVPYKNDPVKDRSSLPLFGSPMTRTADPIQIQMVAAKAAAGKNSNSPPVVLQASSSVINGVTVIVSPDLNGVEGIVGANTDAEYANNVEYTTANNVIDSFTAPISVTIQTSYGSGKPTDESAYGRGTTVSDVANGDTTLGFHESCHRTDYVNYIKNNAPPKFAGTKGMKVERFEQAKVEWIKAWAKYHKHLLDASMKSTDQVGNPTLADFCKNHPGESGECGK